MDTDISTVSFHTAYLTAFDADLFSEPPLGDLWEELSSIWGELLSSKESHTPLLPINFKNLNMSSTHLHRSVSMAMECQSELLLTLQIYESKKHSNIYQNN